MEFCRRIRARRTSASTYMAHGSGHLLGKTWNWMSKFSPWRPPKKWRPTFKVLVGGGGIIRDTGDRCWRSCFPVRMHYCLSTCIDFLVFGESFYRTRKGHSKRILARHFHLGLHHFLQLICTFFTFCRFLRHSFQQFYYFYALPDIKTTQIDEKRGQLFLRGDFLFYFWNSELGQTQSLTYDCLRLQVNEILCFIVCIACSRSNSYSLWLLT